MPAIVLQEKKKNFVLSGCLFLSGVRAPPQHHENKPRVLHQPAGLAHQSCARSTPCRPWWCAIEDSCECCSRQGSASRRASPGLSVFRRHTLTKGRHEQEQEAHRHVASKLQPLLPFSSFCLPLGNWAHAAKAGGMLPPPAVTVAGPRTASMPHVRPWSCPGGPSTQPRALVPRNSVAPAAAAAQAHSTVRVLGRRRGSLWRRPRRPRSMGA